MLIRSQITTPDGTVLRSYSVHDYVSHTDANGDYYFLDGGLEYIRSSYNKIPATEEFIYHDDPFEIVREVDFWGGYGREGNEPLERLSLSEMSYGHIEAILETQFHIPFELATLFEKELEYRRKNEAN